MEEKVFNVTLPEDLHTELKVKSIREKTTMNDLIIIAVKELLERKEEKNNDRA